MHRSKSLRPLAWISALALFAALLMAFTLTKSAQAIGNAAIYWVYDNGGTGNRIVNAAEAATLTPNAITPATAAGYTARTVATDGTYIYFVDNSSGSLVKTDRDGTNRTVIATVSGVQQVAVQGGLVYYAAWNNGIYTVPVSGGTPTQIIAPSFITNTCAGAPGGWGGVTATADNIFFSWYNGSATYSACYGVYKAARSGATYGTPSKLAAPTGGWTTAGWLQLDGNDLYISMASNSFDKTSDYSTWTRFSVSPASFSLQALSVYGSSIYLVSNTGSVYTMPKTDTAGASITRIFTNAASSSGWQILAMAPPTWTVTYQNGGGAGSDLVQTIAQGSSITLPTPVACPASATNPCFTPPTGKRSNDWETVSGTFTTQSAFPSSGVSITPSSNVVLKGRWTGGPLTYSLTSGGNAVSSVALRDTVLGATSTQTLYVKNSSEVATQYVGNISVSNTNGLLKNGGTCSSGTTLAANAECTIILDWTPSAAGSLPNGTEVSIQATATIFDSVPVTGAAVTNKTVTFNANTGNGTMANQLAYAATNLTANSFTKTGYTFAKWTTAADGTGTDFADQASYSFSTNITLYAQWTAIPASSSGNTETPKPSPSPTVTPPATWKPLSATVYFYGDSAVLKAGTKAQLQLLAKRAIARGAVTKVKVVGKVMKTTDKSYDMRLSKLRATNVATFLKKLGVKGAYAVTAGGIAPEGTARSRRVEVQLTW